MKRIFFCLVVFMTAGITSVFAQEEKSSEQVIIQRDVRPISTLKSVETVPKQVNATKEMNHENGQVSKVNADGSQSHSIGQRKTQPTIEQQISEIDDHLNAIQMKWSYLESEEELKHGANQENWFETMSKVKAELLQKKAELQKQAAEMNQPK